MALEGVGVASNIAGLINLGLSVSYGIWKYYGTWRDAESDVKIMYNSIETLTKSFAILKDTLSKPCYDARLVGRVEDCIGSCEEGIGNLDKKLKKIQVTPQKAGGKWTSKTKAHLQRALYPFKESTLVKLKEISSELQDHLQLALTILQV